MVVTSAPVTGDCVMTNQVSRATYHGLSTVYPVCIVPIVTLTLRAAGESLAEMTNLSGSEGGEVRHEAGDRLEAGRDIE